MTPLPYYDPAKARFKSLPERIAFAQRYRLSVIYLHYEEAKELCAAYGTTRQRQLIGKAYDTSSDHFVKVCVSTLISGL